MADFRINYKVVFDKLPKWLEGTPEVAEKIVHKTTFDIGAEARATAPIDTGHLRNTHHEEFPQSRTGIMAVSADYAAYVHDGTRYVAPRPWAAQAAMHQFPAFQDAFRALEDIVK